MEFIVMSYYVKISHRNQHRQMLAPIDDPIMGFVAQLTPRAGGLSALCGAPNERKHKSKIYERYDHRQFRWKIDLCEFLKIHME